jgi:hypothetical protein
MTGLMVHILVWMTAFSFPFLVSGAEMPPAPEATASAVISEVVASPVLFNPASGEKATISYRISHPAKTSVRIFDPDHTLVREIMADSTGKPEPLTIVWDGKDTQGRVVPDEAYFFTIEAFDYRGRLSVYDPATFSGGEVVTADGVAFDKNLKTIFYNLPDNARVTIKAGIAGGGPLLKNILPGLPRAAGPQREIWNGTDESALIDVPGQRNFSLMVEAVSLIENSLIARGNSSYDFFEYARDIARQRPQKIVRPFRGHEAAFPGLPPKGPASVVPEPKFRIEWPDETPKTDDNVPIVSDKASIRILLNEKIKTYITEQRYEIILFVDFRFVTEMEEGYSPFNIKWNTRETANGEHLITVNVATLTGNVSSASTRLMVRNNPQ